MFRKLPRPVSAIVGTLLSVAVAVLLTVLYAGRPSRAMVPLAFTVALLVIAFRYGASVGLVGSLLAAGIFALFLFAPEGSLRVESGDARRNLAWMMLAGITLPYLLSSPPQEPSGRK